RNAGLEHVLVIDASGWGQDWEYYMRDNATQVKAHDSQVVFSVHMYDVFDTDSKVNNYMTSFQNDNLCLLIGEFADTHGTGKDVAEDAIMNRCEQYDIGYLGWSWCGNSGDLSALDIVNSWNGSSLTTWGDKLVNGVNGISATAVKCTVF
ncbi:MAG TPA: cellulase family glycosylhydrolase, partial [Spirochaetota bacterium]|nr:cellulase family glycosylhydrolase [Spirochaetota bacterium]